MRLQPFAAPMLSSSCDILLAPIITDVTIGFCSNHRSATWATDFPAHVSILMIMIVIIITIVVILKTVMIITAII